MTECQDEDVITSKQAELWFSKRLKYLPDQKHKHVAVERGSDISVLRPSSPVFAMISQPQTGGKRSSSQ